MESDLDKLPSGMLSQNCEIKMEFAQAITARNVSSGTRANVDAARRSQHGGA